MSKKRKTAFAGTGNDTAPAAENLASIDAAKEAIDEMRADLGDVWQRLGERERETIELATRAILQNTAMAAAYPERAPLYQRNIEHAKGTLTSVAAIGTIQMSASIKAGVDKAMNRVMAAAFSMLFAV